MIPEGTNGIENHAARRTADYAAGMVCPQPTRTRKRAAETL